MIFSWTEGASGDAKAEDGVTHMTRQSAVYYTTETPSFESGR